MIYEYLVKNYKSILLLEDSNMNRAFRLTSVTGIFKLKDKLMDLLKSEFEVYIVL